MSLEVPPAEDAQDEPQGSPNPDVDELLRRLLVGELDVKVDPVSGQATAISPDKDRP